MKFRYIIYTLLFPFLIASCEDYFDPPFTGSIEEDGFYDNLNNLRMGLSATYNIIQRQDYQMSELLFGEAFSDNMWTNQDVNSGAISEIVNFQFSTENSYILTRYTRNYQGINKANQVIRSVPNLVYKDISSAKVEIREVCGQAKVLRALFYFNLVRTFGGVSIQPEQAGLDDLIVPRSTEAETYAYIEKDLRESLLLLRKNQYQQEQAGQIGIGGGLGLLMKVLLYQASPGIDTPQEVKEQKWREAYEIGQYFIEGKDITINNLLKFDERYNETWEELAERLLIDPIYTKESVMAGSDVVNLHQMSDFDKIFRLEGEFSPESLIEINHYDYDGLSTNIDEGYKIQNCFINFDSSPGGTLGASCSNDVYTLMNNDPRRLFSVTDRIYNAYYTREGAPVINGFTSADGYMYVKYYVFKSEGSGQGRNYRLMRYPEALLIYAEVLNELGYTPEAVTYVNKVRERARRLLDPSNPNAIYNSVAASNFRDVSLAPYDLTRDAILREKRIEMAGEMDRWYEICRLGIAAERMAFQARNLPVESSGKVRVRGQYFKKGVHERFPIPYREVFISNGIIEQNFGY